MKAVPWDSILQGSTLGFSFCKIIANQAGAPVDYEFVDVNDAYAEMVGLSRAKIRGKRVTALFPDIAKDSFNWIDFFGRVALGGEKAEFEEYSKTLESWFHISVTSPEPGYFCAISFDITEQRKAEMNLGVSEERNRRYVDNAPDAIFIADQQGRFIQSNPAAAAMLGFTMEELGKKSIYDIVPPESFGRARDEFAELVKSGKLSHHATLMKKSGERFTVILDAVALPEKQYMAFCKDITALETLHREKDRYYIAFQAMTQPVIFSAADGTILDINGAFTAMYGYAREETIGQNPRILNPGKDVYLNLGYSCEEYDTLFDGLWKAITDPEVASWEGVMINRKKNGSLIWVNLVVNSLFDSSGALTSMIGLPIDITNTRELENRNRIQLYQTIADLAELRDDETGNHMKRTGILARILAKASGLSDRQCNDLELFAPMHDIGKVGILDSILRAPRSLTEEEFTIMKSHTVLGHNIVKGKKGFEMAAEITLSHHERFDGTGYPEGLAGDEIPIAAHVTSVVDVYDALRSKRPYKEAWTHEEAVNLILSKSGTQFAPHLITAFSAVHERFARVWEELKD